MDISNKMNKTSNEGNGTGSPATPISASDMPVMRDNINKQKNIPARKNEADINKTPVQTNEQYYKNMGVSKDKSGMNPDNKNRM